LSTEPPKLSPELQAIAEKVKRKTRAEIIRDGDLVKYPQIKDIVNAYLKGEKGDKTKIENIQEPYQASEVRTEVGVTPPPEFSRDKLTDLTETQDTKLKEAIEKMKEAYVHKLAATGKCIVKIFGMRDGDEDVWFEMSCNYRDLMMGETRVLRQVKGREVDLRRQLDFYDATRGRNEPEYNKIMTEVGDLVYNWQQKMMQYYWGIKEIDFDLLHSQDVNIAILVAMYREENIYPNFRKPSDDFFSK
jgi:hypothetical protein